MRIGELAARAGVSIDTIRAWERRYELLQPERTAGGQRVYTEADLARLEEARRLLDEGWTIRAAAASILGRVEPPPPIELTFPDFHRRLLSIVSEAVVGATPDGTIVFWNPAAEALLGWSEAEAIGQSAVELLAMPRGQARLRAALRHVAGGQVGEGEFHLRRRDGSAVHTKAVFHPLYDDDGQLVAVAGAGWDLAERDTAIRIAQVRAAELESIAVLGTESARTTDAKRIAEHVAETVCVVLSVSFSCLLVRRGNYLEFIAGKQARPAGTTVALRSGTIADHCFRTERAVWSNDLLTERRFDASMLLAAGFVSAAAVPVPRRGGRKPGGVLVVAAEQLRSFTADDANYLQAIARLSCDAVAARPRASR